MKNLQAEILITLIGKYAYYKNNVSLADWTRQLRKQRDKNPSINECVKFVEWKLENYKLSDGNKRIIESILLYEYE